MCGVPEGSEARGPVCLRINWGAPELRRFLHVRDLACAARALEGTRGHVGGLGDTLGHPTRSILRRRVQEPRARLCWRVCGCRSAGSVSFPAPSSPGRGDETHFAGAKSWRLRSAQTSAALDFLFAPFAFLVAPLCPSLHCPRGLFMTLFWKLGFDFGWAVRLSSFSPFFPHDFPCCSDLPFFASAVPTRLEVDLRKMES